MARVLVVDDDADIRDMLRLVLTDAGHAVHEVADGQAALDFLRTTLDRWIVLLDYMLHGGLDGRDVLEAMAADAQLATRHACIAFPANPELDAPVAALRTALGIPLLPKPFDLDELLAAVAQAEARLVG